MEDPGTTPSDGHRLRTLIRTKSRSILRRLSGQPAADSPESSPERGHKSAAEKSAGMSKITPPSEPENGVNTRKIAAIAAKYEQLGLQNSKDKEVNKEAKDSSARKRYQELKVETASQPSISPTLSLNDYDSAANSVTNIPEEITSNFDPVPPVPPIPQKSALRAFARPSKLLPCPGPPPNRPLPPLPVPRPSRIPAPPRGNRSTPAVAPPTGTRRHPLRDGPLGKFVEKLES